MAVSKAYDRDQKLGGHELLKVNEKDREKPCNACSSCDAFNSGRAMNLIEIDAASNRGIDEIRELREAVRFAPAEGGSKVYIIDEVHQLTKDAFNALLKTLEEPPQHAIFILATTELDKVPATIVSRTQHFDFRRPRRDRLISVAVREGVKLSREAAEAVAFAAEGSVRDAESMLGKIMAVEDKDINLPEVEDVLGIPKREALTKIFEAVGNKNIKEAVGLVNRLYHDGYEMEYLAKMLISFFRDALLAKTDPSFNAENYGSLLAEESQLLASGLSAYSADDLAGAIVEFIGALQSGRRSPIPQLPLELALISIISGHSDSRRNF